MAEKTDLSPEEKVGIAKELYNRGSRNYLVKDYTESADDLSKACELYAEIYGNYADELAMPYMLYAKSLIALAQQGENKLLDIPEEEEEEDDGEEDSGEVKEPKIENDAKDTKETTASTDNGDKKEEQPKDKNKEEESGDKKSEESENNKEQTGDKEPKPNTDETDRMAVNEEPGPSGEESPTKDDEDLSINGGEEEDPSPAENLQIAWEVLEMAVQIFSRQGEPALANLADAYFELAEISLENTHFEAAISDFKKSLDIRMKLPENDLRIIAEIHYKIGLNYLMLGAYQDAVTSLKEANRALDCEIEAQKEKDPQNDETDRQIKEIEELKEEIMNKVLEIEEAKEQSMEEVKKELSKLIGNPFQSDPTAGQSTSSSSSSSAPGASSMDPPKPIDVKSKPTDISYLIKRKKPDTSNGSVENGSPAKKPAL